MAQAASWRSHGAAGGKLCPQCGRVEDHAHTLKRCYFSAFMFDTVRKAFGLAQGGGGGGQ